MAGMTDSTEIAVLEHTLRPAGATLTFPAQVYIAFLHADPTDAGTQTNEYGRHLVAGGFNAAANGVASNAGVETVDTAGWSGDTNDLTHFAVVYQASAGTYAWTGALDAPVAFTIGDNLEIPAGGFVFNLVEAALSLSPNMQNKLLDHILGTTQYTKPTGNPLMLLHTADPGAAGTANEFVGGSYARQATQWGAPVVDGQGHRTDGEASGGGTITFSAVASSPVSHWTVHTNNMADYLFGHDVDPDKVVAGGADVEFPAGRATIKVE